MDGVAHRVARQLAQQPACEGRDGRDQVPPPTPARPTMPALAICAGITCRRHVLHLVHLRPRLCRWYPRCVSRRALAAAAMRTKARAPASSNGCALTSAATMMASLAPSASRRPSSSMPTSTCTPPARAPRLAATLRACAPRDQAGSGRRRPPLPAQILPPASTSARASGMGSPQQTNHGVSAWCRGRPLSTGPMCPSSQPPRPTAARVLSFQLAARRSASIQRAQARM